MVQGRDEGALRLARLASSGLRPSRQYRTIGISELAGGCTAGTHHPLKRISRRASLIRNSTACSGVLPRPSAAKFPIQQIQASLAMTRCRFASVPVDLRVRSGLGFRRPKQMRAKRQTGLESEGVQHQLGAQPRSEAPRKSRREGRRTTRRRLSAVSRLAHLGRPRDGLLQRVTSCTRWPQCSRQASRKQRLGFPLLL